MTDTTNDWIEWHGGEQPMPAGTLVEVQLRGGMLNRMQAQFFGWGHRRGHDNSDIIRYRVIREANNPAPVQSTHYADDATLAHIANLEQENAALREKYADKCLHVDGLIAEGKKLLDENAALRAELAALKSGFANHLIHYNADGYRICTEEFMREVVKESRKLLAAAEEEERKHD